MYLSFEEGSRWLGRLTNHALVLPHFTNATLNVLRDAKDL